MICQCYEKKYIKYSIQQRKEYMTGVATQNSSVYAIEEALPKKISTFPSREAKH